MKYWLMSDFHFGHTNKMMEYCDRPYDYESKLKKSLYSIPKEDCLIFLGDYCLTKEASWHSVMETYEYKKILVKGNHDNKCYGWYMEHGWDFACETFNMIYGGKNILFSHRPERGNYDLNIHGHVHNTEYTPMNDKQVLIKMEHEYRPVDLRKLV